MIKELMNILESKTSTDIKNKVELFLINSNLDSTQKENLLNLMIQISE